MHCDQILDELLDFPETLAPEVLEHLSQCARCSCLNEVLSPLKELHQSEEAQQSQIDFESSSSPDSDTLAVAQAAAMQLKTRSVENKASAKEQYRPLKYAVAFLAGVAASLGGIAVLRSEPIQPSHAIQTACLWESEFNSNQDESHFVRSCVACHIPETGVTQLRIQ